MNDSKIILLIEKFNSLQLSKNIDFDKFNQYAITHHSTTIEGSTLTETETRLLLDEGVTPKGKPLNDSLMVKDHFNALQFVIESAKKNKKISPEFIRQINANVMKQTGTVYQTVFGELDSSKGVFRKGNVSAGNSYFVNYDKVEPLVKKLCEALQKSFKNDKTLIQHIDCSFDAHFDLVSIHPFYDGNGRTSRLLMNYLQLLFKLPMSIVFKEDKAEYFDTLIQTRKEKNLKIFHAFMYSQYEKYLTLEITKAQELNKNKKDKRSNYSFVF
ncbi:MAG TPA: Fic family protein [Ginsengibacter sp.]